MSLREFFFENFAGDLEFHPRRAALYSILGIASLCFWIFSPPQAKVTATPLVFALGSLTLLLKGIFLLRKSSEGLGLSQEGLTQRPTTDSPKLLPSLPSQAAQIVQDFGTGSLLLWPVLKVAKDIDATWTNPPLISVFLNRSGSLCFGLAYPTTNYSCERRSTQIIGTSLFGWRKRWLNLVLCDCGGRGRLSGDSMK